MKPIDADYMLDKMEKTAKQPVTYSEQYAFDFAKALLKNATTVKNVITIPENATNGDAVKAMFPNLEWIGCDKDVDFYYLDSDTPYAPKFSTFKSWWNTPYKAESEDNNDKNN